MVDSELKGEINPFLSRLLMALTLYHSNCHTRPGKGTTIKDYNTFWILFSGIWTTEVTKARYRHPWGDYSEERMLMFRGCCLGHSNEFSVQRNLKSRSSLRTYTFEIMPCHWITLNQWGSIEHASSISKWKKKNSVKQFLKQLDMQQFAFYHR